MASGTKPIFVIFIIFSILLLLFINTPAAFAARPSSFGNPLDPNKPPCPTPRGQPYTRCYKPPPTNNVATKPNIKTNN
ncbi:hypothetical protein DsansV1_C35g0229461 [Dioscorea sansibarensis]